MLKRRNILIIIGLILIGCAPSPLNMTKSDLSKIGSNDRFGVVFGSVQIKVEGKPYRKFLSHSLHNTKWLVSIENNRSFGPTYAIEVTAAGDEVPFVTKLPVGDYHFLNIKEIRSGWGIEREPVKGFVKAFFSVLPGKPAYIGKLLLTLPNYKSNPVMLGVGVFIEDAQEDSAQLFEDEYGDIVHNSTKRIMTEDRGKIKKGYYEW